MTRPHQHSFKRCSLSPAMIVGMVLCWISLPGAPAQEAPALLVAYVMSTDARPKAVSLRPLTELSDATHATVAIRRKEHTAYEDWQKFDAEYGIQQKNSVPVKSQIQSAKYGLDVTVFAIERTVKSFEEQIDFRLDRGVVRRVTPGDSTMRRISSNPLINAVGNIRLKADIVLLAGNPYAGLRLVIPLGSESTAGKDNFWHFRAMSDGPRTRK